MRIENLDGYVIDPNVNQQLGVIESRVKHNADASVTTLTTDQLWMTTVGRFAGRPLKAFEKIADPRNWDDCASTKSFFVRMQEVPPKKLPHQWPKIIDETVRLQPGVKSSEVTARLEFDFQSTSTHVGCTYHLVTPGKIIEDRGFVRAQKVTAQVLDPSSGGRTNVVFFRVRSEKIIAFADGHDLAPDPILAMVWARGAERMAECAGSAPAQGPPDAARVTREDLAEPLQRLENLIQACLDDFDFDQYRDAYRKIAASGATGALGALWEQQRGASASAGDPVDVFRFAADAWYYSAVAAWDGMRDLTNNYVRGLSNYAGKYATPPAPSGDGPAKTTPAPSGGGPAKSAPK